MIWKILHLFSDYEFDITSSLGQISSIACSKTYVRHFQFVILNHLYIPTGTYH